VNDDFPKKINQERRREKKSGSMKGEKIQGDQKRGGDYFGKYIMRKKREEEHLLKKRGKNRGSLYGESVVHA